ncbi:MAG: class I SAM-dependent RNA methyltransferase [Pedosphaera sp.]|nr:class I SAM-dependent RNA methyltransferase [Pedosphaera sp.]
MTSPQVESDSTPSAFAVGQHLTLTVSDIAFGGEGVARATNFVVFIPFVALGEVVEVELTEVKKSFGRAQLVRVITPSPDRVTPPCKYFGECGGCQYQHINYDAQLRLKHKQITDLFERVGGFPSALIESVIPCPQSFGYRNRIMIRSQWNKAKQRLEVGYLRHDNRHVVSIDECKIAEPALNEQIRLVRANPPHKGGLKVALRIAAEGWEVPRDSFFQNNFFLLPRLVETVRARLQDSGARHLVDAYCGVGFFSIELADLVDSYAGVEIDLQAIKAARNNAAGRNRTNGDFIIGATEELLPTLLNRFSAEKTCVILDPPRTGCAPQGIDQLRELRPAQIIYVSCHPATLARDLQLLCADGFYQLVKVVPLDMFPQTQHVECVADLRRI